MVAARRSVLLLVARGGRALIVGLIRQGRRFAIAGLFNSLIGYATIVAALALGAPDYLANALGYAVGLCLSFVLHRDWAFVGAGGLRRGVGARYVVAFAIAYTANIAVVASARHFGMIDMPGTHLAAMASYSLCFFLLARHYVFTGSPSEPPSSSSNGFVPTLSSAVIIAACLIVYFAVVMVMPTTHDVVWQLWIGDRLHNGSRLYVDIMEINPPLWFWMAQTVSAVGGLLMLESRTILVAAITLWSAASACLVLRLTSDFPGARLFVTLSSAAVAVYSFRYFGQREHLALLAAIPYAVLIARRRSGASVEVSLALVIGLLASVGFALKHYFVAVPAMLEVWLAVRLFRERRYRCFRPETLALGFCALAYATAILSLTPEFFTTIVPMVRMAYDSYEVDWFTALVRPQLMFSAMAIILALGMTRDDQDGDRPLEGGRADIVAALVLAAVGFAFSFAIQKKGWPYHGLPMVLAAFAALGAALSLGDRPFRRLRSYPLATGLFIFLCYSGFAAGGYTSPVRDTVENMLADVPADEPVAALGSDPMIAWPMVAERDVHPWPLRYYALWMLRALVENEKLASPDPDLRRFGNQVRHETATDLACRPPRMILVDDAEARLGLLKGSFDLLEWLKKDSRFADVFEQYRFVAAGDYGVRAYVAIGPLEPLALPDCRRLS